MTALLLFARRFAESFVVWSVIFEFGQAIIR